MKPQTSTKYIYHFFGSENQLSLFDTSRLLGRLVLLCWWLCSLGLHFDFTLRHADALICNK